MLLMAIKAALFIFHSKLKKVTVTTFLISLCPENKTSSHFALMKIAFLSFLALQLSTQFNFLTANTFFMKETFQI